MVPPHPRAVEGVDVVTEQRVVLATGDADDDVTGHRGGTAP
jgi:hypothetical protein